MHPHMRFSRTPLYRPDGGPTGELSATLAPSARALPFRHLAFGFALGDRLALVVVLLALRQPDLDLDLVPFEVHPERNERQPALGGLADQLADLGFVQEQLPRPGGLVVLERRLLV